ncbi:hypothetical protein ERJ75_000520800 [Trypanosoma vivax]|nr:hypothetical protein ERJ75_000520800 [Trypanosoma vivax]
MQDATRLSAKAALTILPLFAVAEAAHEAAIKAWAVGKSCTASVALKAFAGRSVEQGLHAVTESAAAREKADRASADMLQWTRALEQAPAKRKKYKKAVGTPTCGQTLKRANEAQNRLESAQGALADLETQVTQKLAHLATHAGTLAGTIDATVRAFTTYNSGAWSAVPAFCIEAAGEVTSPIATGTNLAWPAREDQFKGHLESCRTQPRT